MVLCTCCLGGRSDVLNGFELKSSLPAESKVIFLCAPHFSIIDQEMFYDRFVEVGSIVVLLTATNLCCQFVKIN